MAAARAAARMARQMGSIACMPPAVVVRAGGGAAVGRTSPGAPAGSFRRAVQRLLSAEAPSAGGGAGMPRGSSFSSRTAGGTGASSGRVGGGARGITDGGTRSLTVRCNRRNRSTLV